MSQIVYASCGIGPGCLKPSAHPLCRRCADIRRIIGIRLALEAEFAALAEAEKAKKEAP